MLTYNKHSRVIYRSKATAKGSRTVYDTWALKSLPTPGGGGKSKKKFKKVFVSLEREFGWSIIGSTGGPLRVSSKGTTAPILWWIRLDGLLSIGDTLCKCQVRPSVCPSVCTRDNSRRTYLIILKFWTLTPWPCRMDKFEDGPYRTGP